ncbi:MAG: hypothetical protein CSA15_02700 [Candidatus Delongbacteria bacterium]|nr:MAG: hypothetical protein CSA15_02700 [Candidatus Delongbacteria bacterium]
MARLCQILLLLLFQKKKKSFSFFWLQKKCRKKFIDFDKNLKTFPRLVDKTIAFERALFLKSTALGMESTLIFYY